MIKIAHRVVIYQFAWTLF